MATRKNFKFNRFREIHGQIGDLHRELGDMIEQSDKATAEAATSEDNAPDVPVPPPVEKSGPAAHDAARVHTMSEAFPAMRGPDHGLTPELLDRLNNRR